MTLEGSKGGGGAPAADPNIGIAQRQLAEISKEYLDSWKTEVWPTLKEQFFKKQNKQVVPRTKKSKPLLPLEMYGLQLNVKRVI